MHFPAYLQRPDRAEAGAEAGGPLRSVLATWYCYIYYYGRVTYSYGKYYYYCYYYYCYYYYYCCCCYYYYYDYY